MRAIKQAKASVWDVGPISALIQKIHYQHVTKNLKTISVVSANRSEGKTTVAMLTARGLSEVYGLKVLLFDINPEGDLLVNQYLGDHEFQDGFIKGHGFPFDIFRLKCLDMKWLRSAFDGLYTTQLINTLTSHYDVVIVDSMSKTKADQYPIVVNTQSSVIVATKNTFNESTFEEHFLIEKKKVLGIIFNK